MRRQVNLSTYIGDGAARCANCRVRGTSFDGMSLADTDFQRHKQECVYSLGKERQPTKESVGSVQLGKPPELRPQLGHVGETVENVLVEPLNRPMLLPALTPMSTGSCQSSTLEPNKTLQRVSSFSNNVDTARALPEDSIWNLDLDLSSSHVSIPALQTDMSNLANPNAISWTPFATDTDWQFNVDDRLITESLSASTETCSSAFNELDRSQVCKQQTQGFDSTGGPEDLSEFLSLSVKVSPELLSVLFMVALAKTYSC